MPILNALIIVVFCVLILWGGRTVYIRSHSNHCEAKDFAEEVTVVIPNSSLVLQSSLKALTCTGMTFHDGHFYVGNLGKRNSSDEESQVSIIKYDSNFCEESVIYLPKSIKNIQGVTYDTVHETLWYTDTKLLYEIDENGKELQRLSVKKWSNYGLNGLLYDDRDDSLWILCTANYLIHISKDGTCIDEPIKCSFINQDQICFDENYNIYFTVGADYSGDNNFLGMIETKSGKISISYRLTNSYAVEGIVIHNKKLYVANDGLYHSATIDNNNIQIYDFN